MLCTSIFMLSFLPVMSVATSCCCSQCIILEMTTTVFCILATARASNPMCLLTTLITGSVDQQVMKRNGMLGKQRVTLCCTLTYASGQTCWSSLLSRQTLLPKWPRGSVTTALQVLCEPGISTSLCWSVSLISATPLSCNRILHW